MTNTIQHEAFGTGTILREEGMFIVAQFECGVRRIANVGAKPEVVRVSKPAKVRREVVLTPVQEMAQLIFSTTGIWSAEYTDMVGRIHAVAHEMGNEMVDSIAHQLQRTHRVSAAQASVLARFAIANNITF